ncbi:hypothetical protein [Nonomuraea roseoviolacea]|uniref:WD40 repeat domain-containing protein n=1 Tax=Nonomuraea roseoviolacea subsp. carminata TaxID=160689 RepID=A0ABT1JW98_9ACTN|nr:hypothetical protein [Nonomuraea roseoviolacea]MCP2346034.1 hypothetical protein [Nonomuraea roseoviolacea subsp. carminata]
MRLAPSGLVLVWRIAAAVASGIALSTVARSFRMDVGVAERLWAAFALCSVLAVHALVRGLQRRPLPAGPADLVAAELALRSRSARALLAGGTAVALWSAHRGGLPALPHLLLVAAFVPGIVLPLIALGYGISPWQVGPARPARISRALLTGLAGGATALVLTACLLAGWTVWAAGSLRLDVGTGQYAWENSRVVSLRDVVTGADGWGVRQAAAATAPEPAAFLNEGPVRYALVNRQQEVWELSFPHDGSGFAPAVVRLADGGPRGRVAPFTLSGDGRHIAYLDGASRRLVLLDLATGGLRPLTGPLDDETVPEPGLSADGSLVSLTSATGTELLDVHTGGRTRLPGVARVLGLGTDRVIATTGRHTLPGAPDTELLTLDRRGAVLTRVPFDPALEALATPDGRELAVLTGDELVLMDPARGRVLRRAALRLDGHDHGTPRALGWSTDGRLLVHAERSAARRPEHQLVDLATGRGRPVKGLPDDLGDDAVFGAIG